MIGNVIELIEKLLQKYLYQQPYKHIQQPHPKHTSSTALTPQETTLSTRQSVTVNSSSPTIG